MVPDVLEPAAESTYTRSVSVQAAPHPQLGSLQRLIGSWQGEGRGRWGQGEPFTYLETAEFSHTGKPLLVYLQRTRSPAGEAMHTECGYWRAADDGSVELVLAHGLGVVEVEQGHWEGMTLHCRSLWVQPAPTAKAVVALERDVDVSDDTLSYELRMATHPGATAWHLAASLRRVA